MLLNILFTIAWGSQFTLAFPHLSKRLSEGNDGPIPSLTFNAAQQLVNIAPGSGHEYEAPQSTDLRGPCPGLNAAANHNFLPRNGIATTAQTITGLGEAFGMGAPLAGMLAAISIALDGDPVAGTWSIGGPYKSSAPLLLSNPDGISYSHDKYEGDASVTRYDAYLNKGDAHSMNITAFKQLYNTGTTYTYDSLRTHNSGQTQNSIANNPYYFSGPFSGLVTVAAHAFVLNFMSNHSAEQVDGYLDRTNIKSFFGVSGPDNALVWNKGQERIPNNWYKRTPSNPYDVEEVLSDLGITATQEPSSIRFGGNTGKVNSFVGVDLGDLTGGTYTAANLLEGNNLGCFMFQALLAGTPDALSGKLEDLSASLAVLDAAINPIITSLSCPTLAKYDQSLFNQFPGYTYRPTGGSTPY